jgi:hypothetical protein
MNWKWWSKYFFNIDTIIVIFIILLVLYFFITREKKSHKFSIGDYGLVNGNKKLKTRKKKRKPKFNKHEEECRRIFQELFGVRFKSIRPEWLKNPVTGRNLELDGYNPNIKTLKGVGLAFEYDGEQHAKYNEHFHRSGPDEFIYQTTKDDFKNFKCKERGVLLIRIPHFVAFPDLDRYIKSELKRNNVSPFGRRSRSDASIPSNRGIFRNYDKNDNEDELGWFFNKNMYDYRSV